MAQLVQTTRRAIGAAAFLFFLPTTGCTGAGNSLTLFPEGHVMIDSAKALRATNTAALPRELEKRTLDSYRVEPGDGLLILPADLDSPVRLPSDQTVLSDGIIDLGKFGRIQVAGRTIPEIETFVNAAVASHSKEKVGHINVRLVNRVSQVYYVLGEVNSPGSFPLQGRETVLDGIIAAGGLNGKASRANIILVRPSHPEGCRKVLAVCYPEIVQLGDTSTNYQLKPGDRIFVATRTFCEGLRCKQTCVTCTGPQHACNVTGAAAVVLDAEKTEKTLEILPSPSTKAEIDSKTSDR